MRACARAHIGCMNPVEQRMNEAYPPGHIRSFLTPTATPSLFFRRSHSDSKHDNRCRDTAPFTHSLSLPVHQSKGGGGKGRRTGGRGGARGKAGEEEEEGGQI